MSIVAIDFGGTRIRAGRFSNDLRLETRLETPTMVSQTTEQVIQRMVKLAQAVQGDTLPEKIGVAAPGPLDAQRGVIYHAETLPGWVNVPLAAQISSAFGGVPTFIQNDASVAALAEYHLGAGREADPMLYLTLSTGIGGGAMINGQLFTGWRGLAIEPGHMQIPQADGSLRRLEELASGTALSLAAQRLLAQTAHPSLLRSVTLLDGQAVGQAAREGDDLALQVVRQAGHWLGVGLVNLLHLFNPQAIIIGGSVAQLGDLLLDVARQIIGERILDPRFYEQEMLRPAHFGDDVCLYGAALLAAGDTFLGKLP